jgi:glucan phosphoethanolaminetransferase (alkaline phosphatase superfamily)
MLQYCLYLQNHQKVLHTSFLILSLTLLFFCRSISGYFANYDTKYWFDYFVITERLSMAFILLAGYKYLKNVCWVAYEILLIFLIQDVIDRVFYDIKVWNINDTISIFIIVIQYLIRFYNDKK